ncbi:MAG TPA: hypothetical protein VKG44_10655 [Candidatus Baltobacteraceae bacterium]|nr:hypothetical protein [Candidatus Baltobacteraceae bacterium]
MTSRRLLTALPLALLVAVLAHFAGFGTSHALGGPHGEALIFATLAALTGSALLALLRSALGATGGRRSAAAAIADLRAAVPAAGEILPFSAWLLGGALTTFWALELLEGHALQSGLWVVPVAALVALGVAGAVRAATRWLAHAGLALATLCRPGWIGATTLFFRFESAVPASCPRLAGDAHRGRAPPRFA